MKCLEKIVPKTFLGKFSLQVGCKNVGILMCFVSAMSVLFLTMDYFLYITIPPCQVVLDDMYAYIINAIVHSICMFVMNVWFIWGASHKKATVVIAWVVMTSVWWLQAWSFMFLMMMIKTRLKPSWILMTVFLNILFLIFIYCILVGYGYWLELKSEKRAADRESDNTTRD